MSAARDYRAAGVTFVGVNYQDGRASAIGFLDELGRGEGYRYVIDPGSRLALDFGVPETFFLDRTVGRSPPARPEPADRGSPPAAPRSAAAAARRPRWLSRNDLASIGRRQKK